MRPGEEHFDGLDRDIWKNYVIPENGRITARAAIRMYSDEAREMYGNGCHASGNMIEYLCSVYDTGKRLGGSKLLLDSRIADRISIGRR